MAISGFTGNYFCPYHGEPPRPHTSTPEPLQSCKYIAGALCVVCDDSTCKFYPFHNHDTTIRNATLDEVYLRIKAERDPSLEYVDWDSIEAVFIRTQQEKPC